MLRLEKITKTYISKNKNKTEALKNIQLFFPSKGMHLIFGKSGSGKTTLLNILAGLDNEYEGKLSLYHQEIKTKKELENYRKNYVGFIFQDYNLIPDLTIAQNLSVGIAFKNNEEKIKEVLTQVGLSGYENRYPYECSGGEQQRITIARALIKESRILVADEPTGNLDKTNSEEIYELLKEISKRILVIVVSHDEELGKKYADRVIKIQKGVVIEDTQKEEMEEKEEIMLPDKSNALSNKVASKMALHHFTYKKVRTSITILLMVISYCIISFTLSIFQYNPIEPHLYLIEKQNYDYFKIKNVDYNAYEYIKSEGVKSSLYNSNTSTIILDSKKEAEEMEFTFYESEKTKDVLDDNSYYVTDARVRSWFYLGKKAIIDGEEVELNFDDYEVQDLIGNRLATSNETIAGIIKSSYNDVQNENEIIRYDKTLFQYIMNSRILDGSSYNFDCEVSMSSKFQTITDRIHSFYTNTFLDAENIIIEENNELNYLTDYEETDNHLAENEIYISLSCYNQLFGSHYAANYFVNCEKIEGKNVYTLKRQPEHLGETININVYNSRFKTNNAINNLKIKGIVIEDIDEIDSENKIYFPRVLEQKYVMLTETFSVLIKTDSVKNLSSFLNTLSRKYNVEIITPVSHNSLGFQLIDFENSLSQIQLIMFLLCILITIIIILLTGVLISGHVSSRKKEIGILKAMGTRNKDIYKIYIFEILIISIPICVLALTLSPILINYINNNLGLGYLEKEYVQYFRFIYYKWTNIPFTILAIFIVNTLGVFLPLIKINRLNVIKAIKED